MTKQSVVLTLFLVNVVCSAPITEDLIVTLPDGKIQGTAYVTGNNVTYYGFLGIPYATPPVGDLRLELPQPPQPWSGIWDATQDSQCCISTNYLDSPEHESEDCLYLNVYVPTLQPQEKFPVMFWIYGGGFTQGNDSKPFYSPDFIIEENVILVTFNYRLGPFGFISTGDKTIPGNLGLKDQNFALKWAYDNINYFGGDQKKITIFGQSAGGASAGLHLVSKQSTGLFRAAIVQSGGALVPWAIDQDPKKTAYLIANKLFGGQYKNDSQALKLLLKSKSVEEIMLAADSLPFGVQVWPVLEEESDHAFLTESIYELLANGSYNQVPIIIGICAEESLMFLQNLKEAKIAAIVADTVRKDIIPTDLFSNFLRRSEVIEEIRSIYLKEGEQFLNDLIAFAEYFTDNEFSRGIIKQAELAALRNPVYLYQFAYFGRPLTQPFIEGAEKAGHAAEIPFLFNVTGISQTTDPQDLLIQKQMVTLWANFAKYLNPTPTESNLFNNVIWPVFSKQDTSYLNINNTVEVRKNLKGNSYSKWNHIFETYGRKPFITY